MIYKVCQCKNPKMMKALLFDDWKMGFCHKCGGVIRRNPIKKFFFELIGRCECGGKFERWSPNRRFCIKCNKEYRT